MHERDYREFRRAVVIGPEALAGNELYNRTPCVRKLADLVLDFGRPVSI